MADEDLREQVGQRYAAAAIAVSGDGRDALALDSECCAPVAESCCEVPAPDVHTSFGAALYAADAHGELPADAVAASMGCGNPTAVANLQPGERVLDMGSGGGIDVLLSARRVGPSGHAYGVDMTDEMLQLAEANKVRSGLANVSFLRGTIEAVPLPEASIDVVISNCVINLSTDKPTVLAEMHRVLVPGGRIGVSDVVAEDHLTAAERAERGCYVGCLAGALTRQEYLDGLDTAGFTDAVVTFTHEVAPAMHAAIVRAIKPESAVVRMDRERL